MESAKNYADQLGSAEKIRANNIILNTLNKGAAGAVDATFINDLDSRWLGGKRVSLNSNRTIAYDYIIQMLCCVYNMAPGQTLNIGGQDVKIQSGMKEKAYEGLLRMFDLEDSAGRWRFFIFGSNKYSTVPSKFRPKVSTLPDGSLDFGEVRKYIETLNFLLKSGGLANMLKKRDFYDKGAAYVLTAMRNKYIDIKRQENIKGGRDTFAHSYDDEHSLNLDDPTMLGMRSNSVAKYTDGSFDLRDLGGRDNGENPGHNSPKHFVNALKVNMKGKGDLDMNDQEAYGLADHIVDHMCRFVDEKFGQSPISHGYPVIPDLFRAVMTQDPTSLNFICRDEKYKEIYPNAYQAYLGKPANYAQITYNNWQKKYFLSVIAPEFEKVTKQYIDSMEIDMEDPVVPVKTDKDGSQHAGIDFTSKSQDADDKLKYDDYSDPKRKFNRVNNITKKPEGFVDYDHYYQSLEENDGSEEGTKKDLFAAAMQTFMQVTAPK
jgi:hypothetical protein